MNVYLGTTELDDVALQSTGLDAIHLGTDEVWSAAPSTKRLYFDVEYSDGTAATCGDWYIGPAPQQPVGYIDLPMDARGVVYKSKRDGQKHEFYIVGSQGDIIDVATAEDLSSQMPGASFSHFEYCSENGAQKIIINSITDNCEPEYTLGRITYNNDFLVMVFNLVEYSLVSYGKGTALKDSLNSYLPTKGYKGVNSPSSYNYIISGLDGYVYGLCITMPSGGWDAIGVGFQAHSDGTVYKVVDLSLYLSGWDKSSPINDIFYNGNESAVSQLGLSGVTTIEELGHFIKKQM